MGVGKILSGLTLETQSDNVAVCLFYRRQGLRLSGINRDFYRAFDPLTHEVALYWYLWVEQAQSGLFFIQQLGQ